MSKRHKSTLYHTLYGRNFILNSSDSQLQKHHQQGIELLLVSDSLPTAKTSAARDPLLASELPNAEKSQAKDRAFVSEILLINSQSPRYNQREIELSLVNSW